ncbi:MAG TPA: type II toxin-antitoxin system VapC family toxin [Candidatus Paceibacterota bacterium]|nr:type II toxin-antitoxin system VapC family toxin [Verrucomicrobiota bacterium]HRY50893.1 type II toxin-antitoxin system VapC family toxin [Candidatus Paceibacterota bacterium]HSA01703.1 type II toxin-antitoxin system VapC family toxin [Candidatus Paceibacterota bacterium]
MAYWDTSCVLKLYVAEVDSSAYLARAIASPGPLFSSTLLNTELHYGLRRKEMAGDIKPNAADALFKAFEEDSQQGRFVLIPLSDGIQEAARAALKMCLMQSTPIMLRSLDGIHLASALASSQREIVTADQRMLQAALVLGLQT